MPLPPTYYWHTDTKFIDQRGRLKQVSWNLECKLGRGDLISKNKLFSTLKNLFLCFILSLIMYLCIKVRWVLLFPSFFFTLWYNMMFRSSDSRSRLSVFRSCIYLFLSNLEKVISLLCAFLQIQRNDNNRNNLLGVLRPLNGSKL